MVARSVRAGAVAAANPVDLGICVEPAAEDALASASQIFEQIASSAPSIQPAGLTQLRALIEPNAPASLPAT